ncbi:hypothetical protein BDW62DRAFT_206066 [Aspergillus aurantiobrunneus]
MASAARKSTRRYHTKSRTGCNGCRSRRIKCDERHPSCGNCQRAGMECHYAVQSQSKAQSHSPSDEMLSSASVMPPIMLPVATEPIPRLDMLDLSLMHHYTTVTSVSLFGEEQKDVWQTDVPIMARSSPLLMHGLLATAALHMAFLQRESSPSSTLTSRALHHHTLGLQLFNADITTLSSEDSNSHVLFTFALFLVIWAYASPALNDTTDDDDLSTLLASLELVRGNRAIFELSSETILAAPIGRFISPSTRSLPSFPQYLPQSQSPSRPRPRCHDLPQATKAALASLRAQSTDDIDSTAIDYLEQYLFNAVCMSARDMRQPLGWPALIEPPFWERVRARHPSALLILMHYAIILGYYELRAWWMQGWSERLVGAVERVLVREDKGSYDWGVCSGNVRGVLWRVKMGCRS